MKKISTAEKIYEPISETEQKLLQPSKPWLDRISQMGATRIEEVLRFASTMGELADSVRTGDLRRAVGPVLFARISQKLECEGYIRPVVRTRRPAVDIQLFKTTKVAQWLHRKSITEGLEIAGALEKCQGFTVDFVVKDSDGKRLAVMARASSKGRQVIDAIGCMAIVVNSSQFDGGIILADRASWSEQFKLDRDVAPKVQLYFL